MQIIVWFSIFWYVGRIATAVSHHDQFGFIYWRITTVSHELELYAMPLEQFRKYNIKITTISPYLEY